MADAPAPGGWVPLALDRTLFANLDQDAVVGYQTAIENGFVNELGGHTRFPGLREVAVLDANAKRVFLHDFNDDLIACTEKGKVYRVSRDYAVEDVTEVPVSGGRRTVFAKTDKELLMAAGGPILRLRDQATELLSREAPHATHIGWLDNYTIAVEVNSGRFFHSGAGTPDQWGPLDTFAADGNPDNINSLIVTPFRELLLGGPNSIEQFERVPQGNVPFFRRWSVGDGAKLPYAMLFADNALWTVNNLTELVRFSGQTSVAASAEIGRLLEKIDDWSDAWLGGYPDKPLHTLGQKFMILQMPNATNSYGTKGVTLGYDYRAKRYFSLYGWDRNKGVPTRWPGWSHWPLWNKVFVGGAGRIYELTDETYANGDDLQRWLIRTSHIAQGEGLVVDNLRLRLTRGIGTSTVAPTIRVRCSRDGRAFGPWITRSLGVAGERQQFVTFSSFGAASTFMWEISSADDCAINLISAEVRTHGLGHG